VNLKTPEIFVLLNQYLNPTYANIAILSQMKMWALNLRNVDRNSWTNYNAIYSIAGAENENAHSTLRTLM
jgi:hypothetical protein